MNKGGRIMMKKNIGEEPLVAVSYARVSTKKEEQLESLQNQKEHFAKYTKDHNMVLKKIYADEGISGTKTKNRKQFLQMIRDAELGLFQVLLVKDVSRLARNTLDFLTNLRKLQQSGIKIVYLSYGGEVFEGEFMLTFLAALAQEESRNMSSRIKFGKRTSKENGVVPNIVYGYDKLENDAYTLQINKEEAKIVKMIFDLYTKDNLGQSRIAIHLNELGYRTKRNSYWSQNAISRILKNRLYTGKIINGKQEVTDFLSGKREEKPKDEWYVRDCQQARIISDEQFEEAQNLHQKRSEEFKLYYKSSRNKFLFSTLIKCGKCGRSFRHINRKTRDYYVCYNRNEHTSSYCDNMLQIYEDDLLDYIKNYFKDFLKNKESIIKRSAIEIKRIYENDVDTMNELDELNEELEILKHDREQEIEMWKMGVITQEELQERTKETNATIRRLETQKKSYTLSNYDLEDFEKLIRKSFKDVEDIVNRGEYTNEMLKKIISQIDAYDDGRVIIHIKPLEEMGLMEIVRFVDNGPQGRSG